MPRYTKLPITISAVEIFDGGDTCTRYIEPWFIAALIEGKIATDAAGGVIVKTPEGDMTGAVGDYIIQGIKGELYPCKKEIFEATYKPAGE